MLQIPCPTCGTRDEVEFRYGGQAGVHYPENPHTLSDAAWGDFLFLRSNPKGPFVERWVHTVGCRRWFDVVRDTVTQQITPAPDPLSESEGVPSGREESLPAEPEQFRSDAEEAR